MPTIYIDLIALWILVGLLGAGFFNAYAQKETGFRRKKNLIFTLVLAVIWCVLGGPITLLSVIYLAWTKGGWPYGWTLSWKRE